MSHYYTQCIIYSQDEDVLFVKRYDPETGHSSIDFTGREIINGSAPKTFSQILREDLQISVHIPSYIGMCVIDNDDSSSQFQYYTAKWSNIRILKNKNENFIYIWLTPEKLDEFANEFDLRIERNVVAGLRYFKTYLEKQKIVDIATVRHETECLINMNQLKSIKQKKSTRLPTVVELKKEFGNQHPVYTVDTWVSAIKKTKIRIGYWEYVRSCIKEARPILTTTKPTKLSNKDRVASLRGWADKDVLAYVDAGHSHTQAASYFNRSVSRITAIVAHQRRINERRRRRLEVPITDITKMPLIRFVDYHPWSVQTRKVIRNFRQCEGNEQFTVADIIEFGLVDITGSTRRVIDEIKNALVKYYGVSEDLFLKEKGW